MSKQGGNRGAQASAKEGIGRVLYRLGRYEEAKKLFDEAANDLDHKVYLRLFQTMVSARLGDFGKAREYLNEAKSQTEGDFLIHDEVADLKREIEQLLASPPSQKNR